MLGFVRLPRGFQFGREIDRALIIGFHAPHLPFLACFFHTTVVRVKHYFTMLASNSNCISLDTYVVTQWGDTG